MRKLRLLAAVALLVPAAFAQGHAGSTGGSAAHHGASVLPGFVQSNRVAGHSGAAFGRFRGRGFRNSGLLYPWPYYNGFYSDYSDYGYEEPPAPPQPPPTASLQPQASNEPIPAPALLELQGNQWVKVNSFTMPSSSVATSQNGAGASFTSAAPTEMPPAVLVYRDGHTEELTSYTIIGNSIHTKANYWANGAWTRTIQIADLDIPATLKQNQQRGVKFDLPSGPDEVIIRP
jgi:hypothetical protein